VNSITKDQIFHAGNPFLSIFQACDFPIGRRKVLMYYAISYRRAPEFPSLSSTTRAVVDSRSFKLLAGGAFAIPPICESRNVSRLAWWSGSQSKIIKSTRVVAGHSITMLAEGRTLS
jgi:hypothetical protein